MQRLTLIALTTLVLAAPALADEKVRIPGTDISVDRSKLSTDELAQIDAANNANIVHHESRFRSLALSVPGPWYRRLSVSQAAKLNNDFLRLVKKHLPDPELQKAMPAPDDE